MNVFESTVNNVGQPVKYKNKIYIIVNCDLPLAYLVVGGMTDEEFTSYPIPVYCIPREGSEIIQN